jgi:methyl-accepting chemotaxis protein
MESIAQSVVKLGEQSQAIGDIIATVNELAERSNLLAVNAAIEAAKAGEQGKGFTVVAQEVRNLATQSKQATAQVRTILDDIQKAAHVAVLVTEQGTRAVENGVKQSIDASESIRALSHSITDAARAMTQISASSQQQLVGMDQVGMAIDSIKRASAQNAEGMRQIEGAAHDLHQVGQTLKELVEQYKLTTSNGAGHTVSS